jgi:glycosyltransferase involved in cell wall biosynthesis
MGTVCAIILTKNEARQMSGVIANAKKWADQVLIVDSGSTDETVELARQMGADVIFRDLNGDFAAQRNFALTGTQCDWVLYLDADERLTSPAVEKVRAIKAGPADCQYSFKRENIAFGHHFHHGAFGPDRVTRMFPLHKVTWVGKVHERPECPLPRKDLPEVITHHTYESYSEWWNKAGHYTTIWADDAWEQGRRATLGKAVSHAIAGMIRVYLLQGGFLEGAAGILAALQHGLYTAMKYAKLAEKEQQSRVP